MLLLDGTGGSGGGTGTGGGGETGAGGWMGVEGVARDMGTYKALIPILELAASHSQSDLGPSSTADSSAASALSPSDAERARTALDTVRRTGRIEGLLF